MNIFVVIVLGVLFWVMTLMLGFLIGERSAKGGK